MSLSETQVQPLRTFQESRYTFDSLDLRRGGTLSPVTIVYSTWGKLNEAKDNAILVTCGLAIGTFAHDENDPDGHMAWWNAIIGPNRPLDTRRYFVICPNPLAGNDGSTGPYSINPATQQPYRMDFPLITVHDIVETQRRLIEHLGIECLEMVIGNSFGGQQALEWAVAYPDLASNVAVIGAADVLTPLGLAWTEIGCQIIKIDPRWQNGNYSLSEGEALAGLAIARMLLSTTCSSEEMLEKRFGRTVTPDLVIPTPSGTPDMGERFAVENYLYYMGGTFAHSFDPNSYLYLARAFILYNVSDGYTSLEEALGRIKSRMLFIGSSSDILVPPTCVRRLAEKAQTCGVNARYCELQSPLGHNAFVREATQMRETLWSFMGS
jgi:homoserine O-acetyltransferase/O-succinyltransferase